MSTRSWAPVPHRSATAEPWAQTRDRITAFPTVARLDAAGSDGRRRRWLFSLPLGITRFLVFLQTHGRKAASSACLRGLSRPPRRCACDSCHELPVLGTVCVFPCVFTEDRDLTANSGTFCLPLCIVCTVNILSPSRLVFQFLGVPCALHRSSVHRIALAEPSSPGGHVAPVCLSSSLCPPNCSGHGVRGACTGRCPLACGGFSSRGHRQE